jgi:uncharacterized protein YbaR (Trm112 family)
MQASTRILQALEMIVCPVCYGKLRLEESPAGPAPISGSVVICAGCARHYPVEDGIPVLLEARAKQTR